MRFIRNFALMALVNVGIILTLSFIMQITGLNRWLFESGAGYGGLAVFCLFWGMGGAFISLLMSKTIAKWVMRIKVIRPGDGDFTVQKLQQTLARVAKSAGLVRVPELGIYESAELNAFATGRSARHALVAVSTGLAENMSDDEIEGVLAHEITHIKNGDMVTLTLLQGIVNALVMFLARLIAFAVTSNLQRENQRFWLRYAIIVACEIGLGLLGVMVTAWFSRRREFRADAGGAQYSSPQKMLAALEALQRRFNPSDERAPQLAAFKIASNQRRGFFALLATHPPLAERIAALKSAAAFKPAAMVG